MNADLARAIVASFRGDDATAIRESLSAFSVEDWSGSYAWLDISGLELYFLDRLRNLEIADVPPPEILRGMERRFADNKLRMAGMFAEFVRIDRAFRRAELTYCNVLGFALAPVAYPNPALRRQLSFDFIALHGEVQLAGEALGSLEYIPAATSEQFWEWHPASDSLEAQVDIYQSVARRSVRMFYVMAGSEGAERAPYDMLMRRETQTWNGYSFETPTASEHFICLAIRMLGQMGIEWTRLAFLLEFKATVEFWRRDNTFWREVLRRAGEHPLRPVALGTAVLATTKIFGGEIPRALEEWASAKVDPGIRRWSEEYGWGSLLTEFPGTTLLSLLEPAQPAMDERPE
jgi:hypothetical protein